MKILFDNHCLSHLPLGQPADCVMMHDSVTFNFEPALVFITRAASHLKLDL